jgi:hypothetical protein
VTTSRALEINRHFPTIRVPDETVDDIELGIVKRDTDTMTGRHTPAERTPPDRGIPTGPSGSTGGRRRSVRCAPAVGDAVARDGVPG